MISEDALFHYRFWYIKCRGCNDYNWIVDYGTLILTFFFVCETEKTKDNWWSKVGKNINYLSLLMIFYW